MTDLRTYDNTRISDFQRCPRYYFFRHVMHWTPDSGPSLPLSFGGAWHAAMDVMWDGIAHGVPEAELVMASYAAFVEHWIACGLPDPHEIDFVLQDQMMPRVPSRALEMLYAYYEKRYELIRGLELVSVERSFVVPIKPHDEKLFYVGKIDKTVRAGKNRVRAFDHKTTTSVKAEGGGSHKIRPMFLETFSPNRQMDGYNFSLKLTYPNDRVDVWVDVALLHKQSEDFQLVTVDRTMDQLNAWLSDTIKWISKIEDELLELQQCDSHDSYMSAFPKNTNSCFDFNTACPYLPLCKARPNPLTWPDAPPAYKFEKWDPLEHAGNPEVK